MSKAITSACIKLCITCIKCFTVVGIPCGQAGRAVAVRVGVGLAKLAKCLCCGCQHGLHSLSHLVRACADCIGFICSQSICALVGIAVSAFFTFFIWLYWDVISASVTQAYNSTFNNTVELYDRVQQDPEVVKFLNKTSEVYINAKDRIVNIGNDPGVQDFFNKTTGYWDATKDQAEQLANHPDVERFTNKTVEYYNAAKVAVANTFDDIRNHENVVQAINGTIGFFNSLKENIWSSSKTAVNHVSLIILSLMILYIIQVSDTNKLDFI